MASAIPHLTRARPRRGVAAVYLPLDVLRPDPRNPRLHGAEISGSRARSCARRGVRRSWRSGPPCGSSAVTDDSKPPRMIAAGWWSNGIERGGPAHRFDRDAPAPLLLPVRLVDVSDAGPTR